MALQTELQQSRGQVLALTQRFDALAAAHQSLNSEADRLFREKADQITALEARLTQTLFKQNFDLLDLKSMKPEKFSGLRAEAWKPWARKFKAYCNGKAGGFRSALEWAELQQAPLLGNFSNCPWSQVQTADAKLHDFLCATLGGEAGLLAETPGLEGQGFETWRRLTAKYAPTGGQFEIDSPISLLNPKAAKDMAHLPGAIAKFEHDYLQYEKRSGEAFPEKYKVAALVQIMPKTQAADLKWRFANGLSNYDSMVEQIETYSQHLRHESAYGRGEGDGERQELFPFPEEGTGIKTCTLAQGAPLMSGFWTPAGLLYELLLSWQESLCSTSYHRSSLAQARVNSLCPGIIFQAGRISALRVTYYVIPRHTSQSSHIQKHFLQGQEYLRARVPALSFS